MNEKRKIVDWRSWIVDWRIRFFVLPLEVLNLHTGRATRPRGADSSGMERFTAKVAKESEKMRS
jgi:hypothetical protein